MKKLKLLGTLDIRPRLPNRKTWAGYHTRFDRTSEQHPGRNHPELIRALLNTQGGDWPNPGLLVTGWSTVFDPMCGIGTVIREALLLKNARAIGHDIWPAAVELAKRNTMGLDYAGGCCKIRLQDSCDLLFKEPWADVVITSPPFPNNHSPGKSDLQTWMRQHRGMGAGHAWSGLPQDVAFAGKGEDRWAQHCNRLTDVWQCCHSALKPGKVAFVITRDHVWKNQRVEYTRFVADTLTRGGLVVLGMYRRPLILSGYHQRRVRHFKDTGQGSPVLILHEDVIVAVKQ